MNQQIASTTAGNNGESTLRDLFALTDEQILEIEPEAEQRGPAPAVISSEARNPSSAPATSQAPQSKRDSSSPSSPRNDGMGQSAPDATATSHESLVTSHAEPPPWLAAQMKDPWSGEEARELWNGVQQARQEAAAYRAAFATPEDARALKEVYPGGLNEARTAAERARVLDDFDRAYFGAAGSSAQEASASRAQLAQTMLREDPSAFREMVFAGLRALEDAGQQPGATLVGATLASPGNNGTGTAAGGASLAPTAAAPNGTRDSSAAEHNAHLASYASFEKAANEELERSVGATIERTLNQALPNAARATQTSAVGTQHAAPLQARLGQVIRQDVEAALKGDRQLSEQIAQILSARRFDEETRAQVVRLIGERAQQLVPVAAKRVLNDWTQTTLAAHRSSAARGDAASTRREVEPASSDSGRASVAANSPRTSQTRRGDDPNRGAPRLDARRVDYRKLSDEQILDL